MNARTLRDGISWVGAIDWDRRLFDSLVPLPEGTSYNAYLVKGSDKTVLIDTVDPSMAPRLASHLASVERLDYLVSNHAEQDHSGSIGMVLARYPEAKVLATPKGVKVLHELLRVPEDRMVAVADGERLSLGSRTLQFVHTPWVHWPETMCTYLEEDGVLFSCDLFGSHLASSNLFADSAKVFEPAKRYYAEIMMPLRQAVQKAVDKVRVLPMSLIAPSHGPAYDQPEFIINAYASWTSPRLRNVVLIPAVSMHGSTKEMVEHLTGALVDRGVGVERFELPVTDIGKLAISLVDAATVVLGSPTFMGGPHPLAVSAAYLVDLLRPPTKHLSFVGSYSWGTQIAQSLPSLLPHLKVEVIPPVLSRGFPTDADRVALDELADRIATKHKELDIT